VQRFQALLIAAGLAAAPASAVGSPPDHPKSNPQTIEKRDPLGRGRLGVMVLSLTPELRKHFGAAEDRGVLVAHVEPDMPAAASGIAVGDVIVEVHGKAIASGSEVLAALADVHKGQSVTLEVMRDAKPRSIQTTLTDDPPASLGDPSSSGRRWLHELLPQQPPTGCPFDDDWFYQFRERLDAAKPNETSWRS